MDLSDLGGGAGGWLSSLLGGGDAAQPTSLAAPGAPAPPAPDSAGLPVNGTAPGGPTVMGAVNALGQGAPAIQKVMARPAVPAPTINMPQPHPQPYAQALAAIMAKLQPKPPQNPMTPQGTQ